MNNYLTDKKHVLDEPNFNQLDSKFEEALTDCI